MEVMDAPFRAGDLTHGYQAVADNLPNDPRVHEQKGSKKLFFKNFMDARVNHVIIPVARHMLRSDQAAKVSGEGYLLGTIMHEIAHGLGPRLSGRRRQDEHPRIDRSHFRRVGGGQGRRHGHVRTQVAGRSRSAA